MAVENATLSKINRNTALCTMDLVKHVAMARCRRGAVHIVAILEANVECPSLMYSALFCIWCIGLMQSKLILAVMQYPG